MDPCSHTTLYFRKILGEEVGILCEAFKSGRLWDSHLIVAIQIEDCVPQDAQRDQGTLLSIFINQMGFNGANIGLAKLSFRTFAANIGKIWPEWIRAFAQRGAQLRDSGLLNLNNARSGMQRKPDVLQTC